MCGTPDYGSLVLMAERMIFFTVAAVGIGVSYYMLNRVSNKEFVSVGRRVRRLFSHLRHK